MSEDDDLDAVFLCEGCGRMFPVEDRAEEGQPHCVRCWEQDAQP